MRMFCSLMQGSEDSVGEGAAQDSQPWSYCRAGGTICYLWGLGRESSPITVVRLSSGFLAVKWLKPWRQTKEILSPLSCLTPLLSAGNGSDALWTLSPDEKGILLQVMTSCRETWRAQ